MTSECTECAGFRGALLLDHEKGRGTCFWCHYKKLTPGEEDQKLNLQQVAAKNKAATAPKKKKIKRKLTVKRKSNES